jgi:hypothetical protein
MDWQTFLSLVGVNGLLTWFIQLYFKLQTDKEIKRLEAELSRQHFTYSQVFVTTEQTISTLYAKTLNLLDALEDYTKLLNDNDPDKIKEQIKILDAAITDFYTYYRPRKIYLRKGTHKLIDELDDTVISLLRTHNMGVRMRSFSEHGMSEHMLTSITKNDEKLEALERKVSPLLRKLEGDFQEILGFPSESKN